MTATMKVTILTDWLYRAEDEVRHGPTFACEAGRSWSFNVPDGHEVEPDLIANVYDDDDERYYTIKVEGMPVDMEGAEAVYSLFMRHAGATRVTYRGRPDLEIG